MSMLYVMTVIGNFVLIILGLFLILLILIQRGKGGGLIGALGGAGGSSPFGSRAGDQFTRLTIYVAVAWLIITMAEVSAIQNYVDHQPISTFASADK
jgi:preprotein translocase subunit SecG